MFIIKVLFEINNKDIILNFAYIQIFKTLSIIVNKPKFINKFYKILWIFKKVIIVINVV